MTHTHAWGHGLATIAADGTVLDTWFPEPALGPMPSSGVSSGSDVPADADLPAELTDLAGEDARRTVRLVAITVAAALTEPPLSTSDAYLRLHLLSHLLVAPNTINLVGLFGQLPNVVWTSAGPMLPDAYAALRPHLQRQGITVHSLDKFPRLLDFVVPPGVRIADANRVRLGAHLSPGTTVMHEGFVNFNAGTLGASMVEGRISQGVVVGDGSDVGGGASVMGTLSGGGTARISIGKRALLGANSGIGISLGDDCVVEAGLYVTAGTKVALPSEPSGVDGVVATTKAEALSGVPGLLFRRNSLTGAVEALPRAGSGVTLNAALHA